MPIIQKKIDWDLTDKQLTAYELLEDKITEELLFGGGAGGGKSELGAGFIILTALEYPGIQNFIGRKELKRLKSTTLKTFFDLTSRWRLSNQYVPNWADSSINWKNGSKTILIDLNYIPSDPEFERLGSYEFTNGFVDESGEIISKCKDILRSRIRYKLDLFHLVPKLLLSCNPTKNFLYGEFYKPWKAGTLPIYQQFVRSLAKDNPYLPTSYLCSLSKIKDKCTRERLLFGNWEYDDDPARLFEYEKILDIFTNKTQLTNKKYISCDVARFGNDRTVIMIWDGLQIVGIQVLIHKNTTEVAAELDKLCKIHGVPRSNVIVDEDGVGGGVVDSFKGCKGFVNNSRPLPQPGRIELLNYANLKTQCYFELAQLVNSGKIGIDNISATDKELLIEELEQVKQKNVDSDSKLTLISKDEIKEHLGRSPDLADAMMMRMYFQFTNSYFKPLFL